MNPFDKFIKSVGWKFPKGYPDMNNEQDVFLLESLLSKVMNENFKLLKEEDTETEKENDTEKDNETLK